MSRTLDVIRNKNKVEKSRRARRKNEISSLRDKSEFKAKLYEQLQHVEVVLQDQDVNAVVINVPDKYLSQFMMAIYGEDLASYDVEQADGYTNKFYIRRKLIAF